MKIRLLGSSVPDPARRQYVSSYLINGAVAIDLGCTGFYGTVTVKNSSSITGNTAPAGFGADVYNAGVVYLEVSTSIIGILDGNPAKPI